jgi:small subunit ribosomal protein S11
MSLNNTALQGGKSNKKYVKKTKKQKVNIDTAIICVKSSFNNTLAVVTTLAGDVLLRCSGGHLKFKGARKATPYAASQIGATIAKDMHAMGIKHVEMNLSGIGIGRDSVVRAIQASGFQILSLRDVTPIAFAGCRRKKRRRV